MQSPIFFFFLEMHQLFTESKLSRTKKYTFSVPLSCLGILFAKKETKKWNNTFCCYFCKLRRHGHNYVEILGCLRRVWGHNTICKNIFCNCFCRMWKPLCTHYFFFFFFFAKVAQYSCKNERKGMGLNIGVCAFS